MWRCKHVADALAKHHYWDLPWAKRVGLKTHVCLCVVCGRFHRQVMIMQDAVRAFRRRENDQLEKSGPCLSGCDKDAIKNALRHRH